MKRFRGFTLAEVLLVLAIVGVVAALTMPVLINKINDKVLETQHKKARAVLANGVKMMIAKNTTPFLKDTALKKCREDRECIAAEIKKEFKVVDDNLSSNNALEINYEFDDQDIKFWKAGDFDYIFTVADGSTFGILKNGGDKNSLLVVVDVNGSKNPNRGGSDLCRYEFDDHGTLSEPICETSYEPPRPELTPEEECLSRLNEFGCQHYWRNNECVYECHNIEVPISKENKL